MEKPSPRSECRVTTVACSFSERLKNSNEFGPAGGAVFGLT
jgi:hypothetical protein